MESSGATPMLVPPIVIAEGRDVSFYQSERDVSRHIEQWFPATADYRAFDSEGRRLVLVAKEASVVALATETEPSHADELVTLLRHWLPLVGVPVADGERLALAELVGKATGRVGFT